MALDSQTLEHETERRERSVLKFFKKLLSTDKHRWTQIFLDSKEHIVFKIKFLSVFICVHLWTIFLGFSS